MTQTTPLRQDYWSYVKRQFRKNKRAVYSAWFVGFMAFVAIFADFLANDKPIVCSYQSQIYFPILKEYIVKADLGKWPKELININWRDAEFDWAIRPPIPYSPTSQDAQNSQFTSPFEKQDVASVRWKHWLGTESLGRDVLSAIIHGTRIAFSVGLVSMSIATLIGILMGALAGYFGDNRLQMSRASLFSGGLLLIPAYFYSFQSRTHLLSAALGSSFWAFLLQLLLCFIILAGFIFFILLLAKPLKKINWMATKVYLPIDMMVQRIIEIFVSMPRLFLIIGIVAIAQPSIMLVMAVIGFTSWTEIARFIRAELLRVRSLEYIEAAQALGFPSVRILFKHAIPNAISPVLITIAFGIAAAILTEGFLSFIGVGIPTEVLTWGKLLSISREAPWWFAIAPGFAIFITVTLFNLIGEGLTDALDPRQKR